MKHQINKLSSEQISDNEPFSVKFWFEVENNSSLVMLCYVVLYDPLICCGVEVGVGGANLKLIRRYVQRVDIHYCEEEKRRKQV